MRQALLIPALMATLGCGGGSSPKPIHVGHVATLSGPEKFAGEQASRGIGLAVQEQNARAKEKNERPITVRHSDSRGQLDTLEGEAVRLVSVNKVAALLGGTTPDEVLRLDRARAPILTPLGLKTAAMSDLVFCTGLSPIYQGKVLARFAAETLKPARLLVLVDERREEATLLADAAVRELAEGKAAKDAIQVVIRRFGKDPSFKDLGRIVEEEKAPVVLYAGSPRDLLTLREAVKGPLPAILFGGEEGSGRPLLDAGAGGIYLVTAFVADLDLPRTREFVKQFRSAFSADADVHAALAYDAVRLFEETIRRTEGALEADKFKKEIVQIKDFAGVTGPVSFAADGRLRRAAFVIQLDKGQVKLQKRYDPEE